MQTNASGTSEVTILLAERLDYAASGLLHTDLSIFEGEVLKLDASRVEFISARTVELFLCTRMKLAHAGKKFSIIRTSEAFLNGIQLLGVSASSLGCEGQPNEA